MKFLCDQCKAKYQISDDKVAGKTVRMKCRKCGHMIEVRAAVTETSVSAGLPSDPPPAAGGKPGAPRSTLATSLAQAKPPPPRPTARGEGGSNATKSLAQAKEDEAALLELSSADEWYAAINGVPVGPIRIGELRRKAATGAVSDDSLVWQEGMEEWRPIRTVPELAAMLRDVATGRHAMLATPEPPTGRTSVLPPAGAAPPGASVRPGPARPAPPRPAPLLEAPRPGQAAARSNVLPFASRLATAEKLEEAPPAPEPAPTPASERFAIAADPFALPAAATAIAPPPVAAPTPAAPVAPLPVVAPPPRQPNYIAIGMIVGFAAFGVTVGLVLMRPQPQAPAPQVIVQQVPIAQVPVPTATAEAPAPVDTATEPPKQGGGGRVASTTPKPAASAKPGVDLSALLGTSPGPNAGGGPGGGGPASQLSETQLMTVVNGHKIGVRRTCFERLGASAGNANETVHVTIDGSGHVTSASAEGNNSVVGTCLEKEIRGWTFPAMGATTRTDLPYHFVLQ